MKWNSIDLNLLVIFDTVMRERSTTRAAKTLGVSQPAVSRALARLRTTLGDELFIRTPEGMDPTPHATRLAGPARKALEDLRTAIEEAEPFAAHTSQRTFKLVINNHAAIVFAPQLAAAARTEAPGVVLDLRPSGTLNVPDALDRGEIDLGIGDFAATGERFSDLRLFEDGFAVLMRCDHPARAVDGMLNIEALADAPHLAVTSNGESTAFIDDELARVGRARRVALRVPLHAMPTSLTRSDMIAIITERAAREFARNFPLSALSLPFSSPKVTTAMLWHRRLNGSESHKWLRALVSRVARTL